MMLSPAPYPPAYEQLTYLAARVGDERFGGHALAGCLLRQKKNALWVMREEAALPPPQTIVADTPDSLVWDRRFVVSGLQALAGQGYRLAGLGEAGWQGLSRQTRATLWPDDWLGAPAGLRVGLPAVFLGEKPVSVPQLSWQAADFTGPSPRISPAYIV